MNLPWLGGRDTRLAIRYLDDAIALSDTQAWSYFLLPEVTYEFLDSTRRVALAEQLTLALAGLVRGSEPVDIHLRVAYREYDPYSWARRLDRSVSEQMRAPGFIPYVAAQTRFLSDAGHTQRLVLLGVCLGTRGTRDGGASVLGQLGNALTAVQNSLGLGDDTVSDDEIRSWTAKAGVVARALATSPVAAIPAPAALLAWVIRHSMYPALADPDSTSSPAQPWGRGSLEALVDGEVVNSRRYLRIDQDYGTGYVATLGLSRFPDTMHFPDTEPWMHYSSLLPFPVEISCRASLVPPRKVVADVRKQSAYVRDMANHMAGAGADAPLAVLEQLDTASALEYAIGKEQLPFAYARTRLMVTASSAEELTDRVHQTIDHYRELGIDATWPTGDQLELLRESMPADRVRVGAYHQRHDLRTLAGGMPTAGASVADGQGFAIGETTSRIRTPVHLDLHAAPANNLPSGLAVIGAPGGGKTHSALFLAYQAVMRGAWTVYIDPKADAVSMARLPELGPTRVLDLAHGQPGMLDPFALADSVTQAKMLAIETIHLLLGARVTEHREDALLAAVDKVASEPQPNLGKIVETLLADGDDAARNLGRVLRTISDLPFARLCFAPAHADLTVHDNRLTVITLLGLNLPAVDTPREDYSYEERLSVALLYLVTRMARRLLLNLDTSHPKAIFIDEAWALTATPQGRKLIPEVARMGRSHNTALVLVSQNADDLLEQSVTNCLSGVLAFRSNQADEIESVLKLLGMPDTSAHARAVRELNNGECLMRDMYGRFGRVQIMLGDERLSAVFDTNPTTRGAWADDPEIAASLTAATTGPAMRLPTRPAATLVGQPQ